jgi:hypothetical protein
MHEFEPLQFFKVLVQRLQQVRAARPTRPVLKLPWGIRLAQELVRLGAVVVVRSTASFTPGNQDGPSDPDSGTRLRAAFAG